LISNAVYDGRPGRADHQPPGVVGSEAMVGSESLSAHALIPFCPGVWIATDPVRFVGLRLTATMAVVELSGGRLLLFSPVEMTPERRAAIEALGTIAHLYAPNTFHHLWIGAWANAYAGAVVHAPCGLRAKRPDLRIDRDHDRDAPAELATTFDEVHVDGFMLEECALVHRPSGTLLVADLIHNIGRPKGLWTGIYTRTMGFYDRVALSRFLRWTAFHDRASARASIDRIAGCHFDRLVLGHGSPIHTGARAALLGAYAWLGPQRAFLAPALPAPKRGFCG
jgi:hypothetical protein